MKLQVPCAGSEQMGVSSACTRLGGLHPVKTLLGGLEGGHALRSNQPSPPAFHTHTLRYGPAHPD